MLSAITGASINFEELFYESTQFSAFFQSCSGSCVAQKLASVEIVT